MERQQLLKVLKTYEEENADAPVTVDANDKDSVRVLINDINRTDFDFSKFYMHSARVRLYKNILYEALARFPLKYVQGMAEIATVIVDAYFQDKVGEFSTTGIDVSPAMYVTNSGNKTFVYKEEDEKKIFREFVEDNGGLLDEMRRALVNVYKRKFLVFFKDNFKLYKEANDVFIAMMKKKGVKVHKSVSFKYMNHVLTFFKRVVDNEKSAYGIYRIILSSDPSVLFSLLVIFFDNVQNVASATENQNKITELPKSLAKDVALQQETFIEVKEYLNTKCSSKKYLFFGAAASILAIGIAAVYKMNNNKD